MFSARSRRTGTVLGAALLTSVVLAACGGSGDSQSPSSEGRAASGSTGGMTAQDSARPQTGEVAGSPADTGTSGTTSSVINPSVLQAGPDALARRATIALQVKNIGQAVAKVRATTAAVDGFVLAESIGTADKAVPLAESARVTATTYGEITISVPSSKLDAVIAELGSVGKVIRSTSSSENVGAQIVDTQSRLETMRVSVERVRAFLRDAKDLSQIIALEAELTRRQADLESLEAQLASLKGSVARSPIQVSLTTESGVIAEPQDATGFLAGLKDGWKAFIASVSVVLTVVGAVLPFAVLVLLLGLPALWYLRRRRAPSTPATVLPE